MKRHVEELANLKGKRTQNVLNCTVNVTVVVCLYISMALGRSSSGYGFCIHLYMMYYFVLLFLLLLIVLCCDAGCVVYVFSCLM